MLLVCRERRGFSFQDSAVSAMISKATKKAAFSTSFIAKKKKKILNELFPSNKIFNKHLTFLSSYSLETKCSFFATAQIKYLCDKKELLARISKSS